MNVASASDAILSSHSSSSMIDSSSKAGSLQDNASGPLIVLLTHE